MAIHGPFASWRAVSPDVWAPRVPEQAGLLEVPVVDLLAIGIDADEFGELRSLVRGLERLEGDGYLLLLANSVNLSVSCSLTPFPKLQPDPVSQDVNLSA